MVSWFPTARVVELLDVPELGRRLRVSYPRHIRPGEADWIELSLLQATTGVPETIAVSARLDLPGLGGESKEEGRVVGSAGEAHFRWPLAAGNDGEFAGRLWIYAGQERKLIYAYPVEISVGGPAMVVVWLARIVLGLVCLSTLAAGLYKCRSEGLSLSKNFGGGSGTLAATMNPIDPG